MKFAKHWVKKQVVASKNSLGLDKVDIWGASNQSLEAAEQHANARVEKFQAALSSGFSRREEYEYWLGFVREEVLEELHSSGGELSAVLSRNSYGATVLNAQSMLIGDIDIPAPGLLSRLLTVFGRAARDKAYFVTQIERYQSLNTQYNIKVYETHSGLRFIILNHLFSASDPAVKAVFAALEVDTLYRRLCDTQNCFRARLSPKPWRLGVPRPASRYPRTTLEQREFDEWLREFQRASSKVNVVNEITTLGDGVVHKDIQPVLALHDQFAVGVQKPLA